MRRPSKPTVSTKQTQGPLNGFKQNKLEQKERVKSYKNSKIHNFPEIMSLVKTGSIKKSKAWKGIFQDKNTPTIEQSKSKKIPSTEKCMH